MVMHFIGPPAGCRKIKPDLEPRKALTVFERLSALSIGDLERIAKKNRNIGDNSGDAVRKTAVEVLIKKKNINGVRHSVKNSLVRLSILDNEVGELASQALEKFIEAERQRQPVRINSAMTVEEFCSLNKNVKAKDTPVVKKKKKK